MPVEVEPPPPFHEVELQTPQLPVPSPARSRVKRFFAPRRAKQQSILWPSAIFCIFFLALAGTASAYGLAVKHFNGFKGGSGDEDAEDAPAFLHVCFALALALELTASVKMLFVLIRHLRARRSQADWLADEQISSQSPLPSAGSERREARTPRFLRNLFGSSQRPASEAALPTYQTALTQGARQHARREAAAVGWTAGRRGREMVGTGDVEDLELERLRRMGSIPPQYRSERMKGDKVLERGEAPARSVWRLSHLSTFSRSSAGSRGSNRSIDSQATVRPARTLLGRLSGVLPWFSSSPTSPAEQENKDLPDLPDGKSEPRRRNSHLRQRSQNDPFGSPMCTPTLPKVARKTERSAIV